MLDKRFFKNGYEWLLKKRIVKEGKNEYMSGWQENTNKDQMEIRKSMQGLNCKDSIVIAILSEIKLKFWEHKVIKSTKKLSLMFLPINE
jgi:phosphoribosylformimino-5-aminoimidazole carboxamide ribonucleotide (ProFAR) isomerase